MQPSEFMQNILEHILGFLGFELFISPAIYILCYYLGAVILPVFIYRFVYKNYRQLPSLDIPEVELELKKIPLKFSPWLIFLLGFMIFQVLWRLFFEFMLAYFQIRDALQSINVNQLY